MTLIRIVIASLCAIALWSTGLCAAPLSVTVGCDSLASLSAYLQTAHKMRETARAWQVVPDRSEGPSRPDIALRFWRNDDTGVWAVVRIDPPNCARVVVTGYGWADSGTGEPL